MNPYLLQPDPSWSWPDVSTAYAPGSAGAKLSSTMAPPRLAEPCHPATVDCLLCQTLSSARSVSTLLLQALRRFSAFWPLVPSPSGCKSPWPKPGPGLCPPGFTVTFCCQRRALKNCWHCQNPVCATTPQTSLYFYCSVNYCLNFNKSLRQEGGPAVSFSVQTRAGSDSGVI